MCCNKLTQLYEVVINVHQLKTTAASILFYVDGFSLFASIFIGLFIFFMSFDFTALILDMF